MLYEAVPALTVLFASVAVGALESGGSRRSGHGVARWSIGIAVIAGLALSTRHLRESDPDGPGVRRAPCFADGRPVRRLRARKLGLSPLRAFGGRGHAPGLDRDGAPAQRHLHRRPLHPRSRAHALRKRDRTGADSTSRESEPPADHASPLAGEPHPREPVSSRTRPVCGKRSADRIGILEPRTPGLARASTTGRARDRGTRPRTCRKPRDAAGYRSGLRGSTSTGLTGVADLFWGTQKGWSCSGAERRARAVAAEDRRAGAAREAANRERPSVDPAGDSAYVLDHRIRCAAEAPDRTQRLRHHDAGAFFVLEVGRQAKPNDLPDDEGVRSPPEIDFLAVRGTREPPGIPPRTAHLRRRTRRGSGPPVRTRPPRVPRSRMIRSSPPAAAP